MMIMAAMLATLAGGTGEASNERAVQLEYRIEQRNSKAVVFEGSASLAPRRNMNLERRDEKNVKTLLTLVAFPEEGSTVRIDLSLVEESADGAKVVWNGSLSGQRGDTLNAEMAWHDGGRALRIKLR